MGAWISFFEFVSLRAQRLTQALPLGNFDRLVVQSGSTRAVVIIGADRGVLVKTRREALAPRSCGRIRMNEAIKERITEWLRGTPPVRGVLVRGTRFADETFVCDFDSRDFPLSALGQAWRSVANTFDVLVTQRLPPTRRTWVYERAVLHCVRRSDGAILGAFVGKKVADADQDGLERLLADFELLDLDSA